MSRLNQRAGSQLQIPIQAGLGRRQYSSLEAVLLQSADPFDGRARRRTYLIGQSPGMLPGFLQQPGGAQHRLGSDFQRQRFGSPPRTPASARESIYIRV